VHLRFGGYPTTDNFNSLERMEQDDMVPIPLKDENPYVEAFWKWWPELYYDLDTFRITGGEPLMSKDTWKVLDFIIDNPNPNKELKLAINSNLGIDDNLVDNFIEKLKVITGEDKVKEMIVFTSVDTIGDHAEYIRHGFSNERFWNNIHKILSQLPKVTVTVMSTYNALSPFKYNDLIENIWEVKREYQNNERYWKHPILLDTSYLRYPTHQTVRILEDEHKELILKNAEKALYLGVPVFNRTDMAMTETETRKIKRIYDWSYSDITEEELVRDRNNFITFVDEHDRRRGTNFLKTFPELEDFYHRIKNGN